MAQENKPPIEKEKKEESLDDKIDDKTMNKTIFERIGLAIYKPVSSTIIGAGTLAYTLGAYGVGPAITSFGFMLGDYITKRKNNEPVKFKDSKNQFYLGQIMGSALNYLFKGVNYFDTILGKASYVAGLSIPTFNAISLYLQPYIKNYSPMKLISKAVDKGVAVFEDGYESLSKNFISSTKNLYKKPVPGLYVGGAIINNISHYGLALKYAIAAGLSAIYRIASSTKPMIAKA